MSSSFISFSTSFHHTGGSLCAQIDLLVNGVVLRPKSKTSAGLDAKQLLARSSILGSLHLHTCSCGVSGCVGIEDESYLSTYNLNGLKLIRLELPLSVYSFDSLLAKGFIEPSSPEGAPKPRENYFDLYFSASSFESALNSLKSSLIGLDSRFKKPYLTLFTESEDDLDCSLKKRLKRTQVLAAHWDRQERERESLFGDLLGNSLLLFHEGKQLARIDIEFLVKSLISFSGEDQSKANIRKLVKLLRTDLVAFTQLVRALPPADLLDCMDNIKYSEILEFMGLDASIEYDRIDMIEFLSRAMHSFSFAQRVEVAR